MGCPLKLKSDQAFAIAETKDFINPPLDDRLSEPDLKLIVTFCGMGCVSLLLSLLCYFVLFLYFIFHHESDSYTAIR